MAGAGYKLFATGDVLSASDVNLYLQQQTVMVFASAAARTTALASVLAEGMVTYLKDTDVVEIYTGAAWVSLDDPNAIQNSIVDAKGDIITATADNTPARLAVGTNGQYLQADSTAATGLKWATVSSSPTFVGVAAFTTQTTAWTQNVQATISYNQEDFDTNTFHDNTTNNSRFTIPTGYGGKYLITCVTMTPDDWNGYGYTYLFKNGSALNGNGLYSDGRFGSLTVTAGVSQLVGSSTFSFAAGDYIEMKIQSAWTTANHTLYSRFTATYLGA